MGFKFYFQTFQEESEINLYNQDAQSTSTLPKNTSIVFFDKEALAYNRLITKESKGNKMYLVH